MHLTSTLQVTATLQATQIRYTASIVLTVRDTPPACALGADGVACCVSPLNCMHECALGAVCCRNVYVGMHIYAPDIS